MGPAPIRGHRGTHTLYFNDEAKAIGSGRRLVSVNVGSKWVKVRCPVTGRRARMLRNQFSEIWNGTARRQARAEKGGASANKA